MSSEILPDVMIQRKRYFSEEREKDVIRLWAEGHSIRFIAKECKTNQRTISKLVTCYALDQTDPIIKEAIMLYKMGRNEREIMLSTGISKKIMSAIGYKYENDRKQAMDNRELAEARQNVARWVEYQRNSEQARKDRTVCQG